MKNLSPEETERTMSFEKAAMERMIRCRGKMVLNFPYFATLAMNLRLMFTPKIKQAYTDGILLAVNPEWLAKESDDSAMLLWAEASLKCGLKLPFRIGYRDKRLWNKAATLTVAPYLKEEFRLPPHYLTRDDLADKSCEEIYNILLSEQQPGEGDNKGDGDNSGDDNEGVGDNTSGGKCDVDRPDSQQSKQGRDDYADNHDGDRPEPGGNREIDPNEMANDWDGVNRNGHRIAKGIGRCPAWLDRLMTIEKNSQVDWRAKLREYVELTCRDDYSWLRFNRRHITSDIYLPSLFSEKMPAIAIMNDVSGSVSDREMSYFLAELSAILSDFDTEAHMYQFDTEPKGDAIIFTKDDLPLKVSRRGCGGTDPCSTFAKIEDDEVNPACIIVFSDMEMCSYPDSPPDVPVLWVSSTRLVDLPKQWRPPFGEICQLTLD